MARKKATKKTASKKSKTTKKRGRPPGSTNKKTTKKKVTKVATKKAATKKKVAKKVTKKKMGSTKKASPKKTTTRKTTTTAKKGKAVMDLNTIAQNQVKILNSIETLSKTMAQLFHRVGDAISDATGVHVETPAQPLQGATAAPSTSFLDDQPAAQPVNDFLNEAPTQQAQAQAPQAAAPALSKAQITEKLQAVSTALGLEAVHEILEAHNATRLSEITEAQFASFAAACDAKLNAPQGGHENTQAAASSFLD